MTEREVIHVFVYGTLKHNMANFHLLGASRFAGGCITEDKYDMYNCGFPMIVPNENGHRVKGELWNVIEGEVWDRLDRLEGHPDFYKREVKTVFLTRSGSKTRKAYIYIFQDEEAAKQYEKIQPNERGDLVW